MGLVASVLGGSLWVEDKLWYKVKTLGGRDGANNGIRTSFARNIF